MQSTSKLYPYRKLRISGINKILFNELKLIAQLRTESLSQLGLNILINKNEAPFVFEDKNQYKDLFNILITSNNYINKSVKILKEEKRICDLEGNNQKKKINNNMNILKQKITFQRKINQEVWNLYGIRIPQHRQYYMIQKRIDTLARNAKIHRMKQIPPFYTLSIRIPLHLMYIIKLICHHKYHISYRALFIYALIHKNIIPKIILNPQHLNILKNKGNLNKKQRKIISSSIYYYKTKNSLSTLKQRNYFIYINQLNTFKQIIFKN